MERPVIIQTVVNSHYILSKDEKIWWGFYPQVDWDHCSVLTFGKDMLEVVGKLDWPLIVKQISTRKFMTKMKKCM